LLSPALTPRLIRGGVDRKLRGEDGASDHAPAWIELARSSPEAILRDASLARCS
jgi:hypothetical protein